MRSTVLRSSVTTMRVGAQHHVEAAGRAALDQNLARFLAVDEAGLGKDEWDSIERKDFVLKRTEGLRVITDDNMGMEWGTHK